MMEAGRGRLEAEDLVMKLADGARSLVSELVQVLLHGVDHGRRAAHENLDVVGRLGHVLLNSLLGDKAHAALPADGRLVEEVVHAELVLVLGSKLVELLLEQDVLLLDVGVDKVDLRLVAGVLEDSTDDLQAGRKSSAAGDHAEVARQAGRVLHLALGALDRDEIADLHGADVLGDVTLLVRLDDEVEESVVIVRRCRGVGAHDVLAVDVGLDGDVLSDGEAEDVVLARQLEAVERRVGRERLLLHQTVLLPLGGVEHRLELLRVKVEQRSHREHKAHDESNNDVDLHWVGGGVVKLQRFKVGEDVLGRKLGGGEANSKCDQDGRDKDDLSRPGPAPHSSESGDGELAAVAVKIGWLVRASPERQVACRTLPRRFIVVMEPSGRFPSGLPPGASALEKPRCNTFKNSPLTVGNEQARARQTKLLPLFEIDLARESVSPPFGSSWTRVGSDRDSEEVGRMQDRGEKQGRQTQLAACPAGEGQPATVTGDLLGLSSTPISRYRTTSSYNLTISARGQSSPQRLGVASL
ncbi:hypothetical protein L1887_56633 [Cichorium endivia]|nr:hypothetical protein L1887_56633 [Cichorium endivia]